MKVAIIDYGTGNIASLYSAINSINAEPFLASKISHLQKAEALILPGIGHFGHALKNLKNSLLFNEIIELAKHGLPILGICLGFHILTMSSEESKGKKGLSLLPLQTIRLKQESSRIFKVPHIGWNNLSFINKESKLLRGISKNDQLFYFSNSYGVEFSEEFNGIFAEYNHENSMIGLVEYKNIFGVQFHPEKSRKQGLKLIHNFLFN